MYVVVQCSFEFVAIVANIPKKVSDCNFAFTDKHNSDFSKVITKKEREFYHVLLPARPEVLLCTSWPLGSAAFPRREEPLHRMHGAIISIITRVRAGWSLELLNCSIQQLFLSGYLLRKLKSLPVLKLNNLQVECHLSWMHQVECIKLNAISKFNIFYSLTRLI